MLIRGVVSSPVRGVVDAPVKGGGVSVPLQVVATGTQILGQNTTGLSGTGSTRQDNRHLMTTGPQPASELRFAFANFYLNPNVETDEASGPNSITVEAAFEYSSAAYNQSFSGASSVAIAGSAGIVVGDAVAGLIIPAATEAFMRNSVSVSSNTLQWPVGKLRFAANGEAAVISSNATGQADATGALSTAGGTSVSNGFCALAVIGRPAVRHPAIILAGDSIADAQQYDTADAKGNFGHLAKGMFAGGVPFVKLARGSMRLVAFDPDLSPRMWELAPYATHLLSQAGTNDLAQSAAGEYTLAAIQARYQEIWAYARSRGLHTTQVKILPRVTTTDSGATLDNQTPRGRFGAGQDRDTLNDWFDAEVTAGRLDAVLDLNAIFEDETDHTRWKVNGAANYWTSDGVHPRPAAFTAAVSTVQAWAAALTV